jgi:4-hydroxy-tetrahydrodipicolinate reductase
MMHGCNGRMGQMITNLIADDPEIEIAVGVDLSNHIENVYPVVKNIAECQIEVDAVIDFGAVDAVDELLEYCIRKQIPCVLCTTGLSEGQLQHIEDASKKVAIFKSANMSIGINLLMKVLKEVSPTLAQAGFDIEIVEKHHKMKLDAPSGTALALADSINEAMENAYHYTYDRSQEKKKREQMEIGISAVRGGTIVGDHDVIFAGADEVITFSHTAYSRAIFGKGAIQAAKFLAGKPAGYYHMSDVVNI